MKNEVIVPVEKSKPDFRAQVYLLTPEEGGRKTPAWVGYRPQCWFPVDSDDCSCTSGIWLLMDKERLAPGETTQIDIGIVSKDAYKGRLLIGMLFRLTEGATEIGRGRILEIYNQNLAQSP